MSGSSLTRGGPESLSLRGCTVKNRGLPTHWINGTSKIPTAVAAAWMRATTDHTAHTAEGESWTEQLEPWPQAALETGGAPITDSQAS